MNGIIKYQRRNSAQENQPYYFSLAIQIINISKRLGWRRKGIRANI